MTRRDALHASGPSQLTFDEVGTLRDTTFVVVDLETTGGSAENDAITEIGAVKVRGGEVLGELATLVDPQRSLPPQIVRLTGITSAMLVDAPPIAQVLPAFLEFARGAVLVAHNAGFDIGFLKAAARQCGIDWPQPAVLCTVRLARRVLSRDEAPRVSLGALAQLLGASTTPNHRALDDARATVDVLHALISRVGNQGVGTMDELRRYRTQVPSALRGKRRLADAMPYAPGVYLFRGPSGEVLYVGTAVNLRRRVQQYFTGADPRGRMREMVTIATAVDHVICAHPLEAAVRELRLLGAHAPRTTANPGSRTAGGGWCSPRSRSPDSPSSALLTGGRRSARFARAATRQPPHWSLPGSPVYAPAPTASEQAADTAPLVTASRIHTTLPRPAPLLPGWTRPSTGTGSPPCSPSWTAHTDNRCRPCATGLPSWVPSGAMKPLRGNAMRPRHSSRCWPASIVCMPSHASKS